MHYSNFEYQGLTFFFISFNLLDETTFDFISRIKVRFVKQLSSKGTHCICIVYRCIYCNIDKVNCDFPYIWFRQVGGKKLLINIYVVLHIKLIVFQYKEMIDISLKWLHKILVNLDCINTLTDMKTSMTQTYCQATVHLQVQVHSIHGLIS